MTRHWKSVSAADIDRAAAAFVTMEATDWLMQDADQAERDVQPKTITFAHVQAYALGRAPLTLDVARALKQDTRLRDGLNRLLSQYAAVTFTQQAAASSGAQQAWTTDKGAITLHRSKAQEDQVYVLIEVAQPAESLARLVVTDPDGRIAEAELTEPVSGVIRLIAKNDDPLITLLEGVDSDVYLT